MSKVHFNSLTPQAFKVGKQAFQLGPKLPFVGDLAEFYACSFAEEVIEVHGGTRFDRLLEGLDDPSGDMNGVVKIVVETMDNDLILNEIATLTKLFPPAAKDEKFYRYFARPLAHFELTVGSGAPRTAIITPRLEGYRTMQEVQTHFPKGLDYRDVVWMFKRGLSGLGFAHHNGVVHGAVLPPHVLVHPTGHGAKLIDWAYSVETGVKARAMSRSFAAFYPPEVPSRDPLTSATDIFMLAKCTVQLLGGDLETNELPPAVPLEIQTFLHRCLVPLRNMRPQSAWDLHDEFDALLKRVIGPPSYRKLTLPTEAP